MEVRGVSAHAVEKSVNNSAVGSLHAVGICRFNQLLIV